jgi:hypothetical protein
MIASRFGSSNALGDHVPPLPCLHCCPGRIYCGCEAFTGEDSLTGWTALRARSSGSFGSPSGSHRLRQLRATFRCEVEFSLHLFASARLFHGSGRFLAGTSTRRGRFTLRRSRGGCLCCSKLLFQLGEFLPTFLQPSFEPADPFPETFKVFHIRKRVAPPIVNENDGVDPEEITKPRECHAILGRCSASAQTHLRCFSNKNAIAANKAPRSESARRTVRVRAENLGKENQHQEYSKEQQVNAALQHVGLAAGKRNHAYSQC